MKDVKIEELFNLDKTIAKGIFDGVTYPWEVLPKIKEYILNLFEYEYSNGIIEDTNNLIKQIKHTAIRKEN